MMFDALVKENDIDIPPKDVDFIKGTPLGSQAHTSTLVLALIFVSQTSFKERTGTLSIRKKAFSSKSLPTRLMELTLTSKA